MNEEEFELMVTRARDAEGAQSQPPPGLLDEARTATRRRRRGATIAAGCAVAAVIVATVAVPHLVGGDPDDPGREEAVSGTDAGELSAHGGPCPSKFPAPKDDEGAHGFGTSAPAQRAPRFATPNRAWVCQYGAEPVGSADAGTRWGWSLHHTPRLLDEGRLALVAGALQEVAVPKRANSVCTADLGPRWLLVTSTGGDLAGVVADGYGCGDVRLTDDPFVTAPGDPQEGGTVAGVLDAPGLAATLEGGGTHRRPTWRMDPHPESCGSPAPTAGRRSRQRPSPPHQRAWWSSWTARCRRRAATSPTPPAGRAAATHSIRFPTPRPSPSLPGCTLGCASPPAMDETGTVAVEVVDPYGYWRASTLADFGCGAGGAQPSWVVGNGTGATAQDAVDDLLAMFATRVDGDASDYTAAPAPTGYSGSDTQTWVGSRHGVPYLSILVTGSGRSFTANPDALCGRPNSGVDRSCRSRGDQRAHRGGSVARPAWDRRHRQWGWSAQAVRSGTTSCRRRSIRVEGRDGVVGDEDGRRVDGGLDPHELAPGERVEGPSDVGEVLDEVQVRRSHTVARHRVDDRSSVSAPGGRRLRCRRDRTGPQQELTRQVVQGAAAVVGVSESTTQLTQLDDQQGRRRVGSSDAKQVTGRVVAERGQDD